jgi:hypothetical protein
MHGVNAAQERGRVRRVNIEIERDELLTCRRMRHA